MLGAQPLAGAEPLIEVHHLNNSRSQRILWLLEELGIEYEIVKHQRDPETNLAPESLLRSILSESRPSSRTATTS